MKMGQESILDMFVVVQFQNWYRLVYFANYKENEVV